MHNVYVCKVLTFREIRHICRYVDVFCGRRAAETPRVTRGDSAVAELLARQCHTVLYCSQHYLYSACEKCGSMPNNVT